MPLIDITYDPSVDDAVLRRLVSALPDLVAEAVDCPEEPWIGPPQPAHLMRRRHGGRGARMRGTTKIDADFYLLAAAVNLSRLATLGLTSTPSGWQTA